MRIPLTVADFYSDRKVVFASFFLQIPSMRVARPLTAVVDSGSPFTSVLTRDALTLGIPIKSIGKEMITRLGGNKFYGKNVKATLTFKDSDNKIVKFMREIRILVPTKLDESTIREVQDIPSLIGTDFLEDHRLSFVYDPAALKAYFEDSEVVLSASSTAAPATSTVGTAASSSSGVPSAGPESSETPLLVSKKRIGEGTNQEGTT